MRVASTIILAFYYVFLSIGINVDLHRCKDSFMAIHFTQVEDDCHSFSCCASDKPEDDDHASCCSHELFYLQVEDSQTLVKNGICCFTPLVPTLVFQYADVPGQLKVSKPYVIPPPNIPLYLKEHRFTFYG